MRPLSLRIEGLRSYRKPVEIDFTAANLIAIVGDTGAGKSSILEAITYALFKSSTWDERSVKELISGGATVMSVQLTFRADGKEWIVHRSNSLSNYPPPVNRLECRSDRSVPPLDREEDVNSRIRELLGMDRKAFLSAVILPQGNFQQLLQATTTERTRILKGIFRLGDIERVRDRAGALLNELGTLVARLEGRREGLMHDPTSEKKRAGFDRKKHGAEQTRLSNLVVRLKERAEQVRLARESIKEAVRLQSRLKAAPRGSAKVLSELVKVEVEIAERQKDVDSKRKSEARHEAGLRRSLETADKAGVGLTAARAAYATIANAERVSAEVAETQASASKEKDSLDKRAAELRIREETITPLADDAARLGAAAKMATELRDAMSGSYRIAHEALVRFKAINAKLTNARLDSTKATKRRAASEALSKSLSQKLAEREQERQRRVQERAAVMRLGAVAHAAHGLEPGADCPICKRALPIGFTAPAGPDEGPAEAALAEVEREIATLREDFQRTAGDYRAYDEALTREAKAIEELGLEMLEAVQPLTALLPGADLKLEPQKLLLPLAERLRLLTAEVEPTDKAAKAAETTLVSRRTAVDSEREALKRESKALDKRVEEVETRYKRVIAELAALPEPWRVNRKRTLPATQAVVKIAIAELGEIEMQLNKALEAGRTLADDGRKLERERGERLIEPRSRALIQVASLKTIVELAAGALKKEMIESPAADAPLSLLVTYSDQIEKAADGYERMLALVVEAIQVKIEQGEAAVSTAFLQEEVEDLKALEERLQRTSAELLDAERRERDATRDEALAKILDERLALGRRLIAEIDALRELLGDSRFVSFVIQQRQRVLLGVASDLLNSMTSGRYGFAADFQVVDKLTGQPRPARTLSGGETFLASLALALALVEIASRSGGKLDALFLDEGFGSLDANALDEALSALEQRAASGRLVAIVSHVKAVADRIECVLRVARTPSGSEAVYVKGTEREEYLERIEAGLLA